MWQFWHGTSNAPCGLRLLANGARAKAEIQGIKANARTSCSLIEVKFDPKNQIRPHNIFL